MVLLKAERAQAALAAANEAVERAETIAARLNSSLALLRSRRDELAVKMIRDTELALNHPDASPTAIPVPAPPVRRWSYF